MKNIMRGCLAAATALVFSTSVMGDDSKPFSGPYVGIEGGFGQLKDNGYKDASRWSLGGVAGYRHQFDNDLVLGLEGGVQFTPNLKASSFGSLFDRDYKPTWSASALLGYAFGESKRNMLFVKGGYSRLRYDVALPASLAGTDISDALKASLGEFKKGAFKLGAGYERKLTDTFSVRAGVDYVKHKDIHKQLEAKVALIVSF